MAGMPDVLVRKLAPEVVARLKSRAAAHGRSLQQEAAEILASAAGETPADALALARRVRERIARRTRAGAASDSTRLVREDRAR